MAWNEAIKAEWDKHQSNFAITWRVAMVRLGKLRIVPDGAVEDLREAIHTHSTDNGVVEVLLKDAHLVEAALASDLRVVALDDTVRGHLCRLSATFEDLRQVLWINPTATEEECSEWLESGAPPEAKHLLQPPSLE